MSCYLYRLRKCHVFAKALFHLTRRIDDENSNSISWTAKSFQLHSLFSFINIISLV